MTRGNQLRSTLQAIIFALTILLYYAKLSTSSPDENDEDQLLVKKYILCLYRPEKSSTNSTYVKDNQHHHRKCDLSSLRLPPTSCRQLAFIGHRLNGIYLIANPDTNKIETVYCDFGANRKRYFLFVKFCR